MNTFSPTEAIKFGWKTFKANPGFLIGLIVILILPSLIVSFLIPSPKIDQSNFTNLGPLFTAIFVSSLISGLISVLASLGVLKALLMFVDTGKGDFANILVPFKQTKILINYFLAMLLIYGLSFFGIIVFGIITFITFGIGLLILIPVAIYLSIRISLFSFYIIDKAAGPVEALKLSWNDTKGNMINLMIFGFLSWCVMILGMIALFVGLLAAVPVVLVATIYVYKMLSQQQAVQPAPVAPVAPVAPIAPVAPMPQTPPPTMPAT